MPVHADAINPLDVACPACEAQEGERTRARGGLEHGLG